LAGLPDRTQHAKHFDRKRDAEVFLVEVQHKVSRGDAVDLKAGRTLLRDWWAEWVSRQLWRPRTIGAVRNSGDRVLPLLGDQPLGSLRPADVQRALRALSERGLSRGDGADHLAAPEDVPARRSG
jgi:hypothetical protein